MSTLRVGATAALAALATVLGSAFLLFLSLEHRHQQCTRHDLQFARQHASLSRDNNGHAGGMRMCDCVRSARTCPLLSITSCCWPWSPPPIPPPQPHSSSLSSLSSSTALSAPQTSSSAARAWPGPQTLAASSASVGAARSQSCTSFRSPWLHPPNTSRCLPARTAACDSRGRGTTPSTAAGAPHRRVSPVDSSVSPSPACGGASSQSSQPCRPAPAHSAIDQDGRDWRGRGRTSIEEIFAPPPKQISLPPTGSITWQRPAIRGGISPSTLGCDHFSRGPSPSRSRRGMSPSGTKVSTCTDPK